MNAPRPPHPALGWVPSAVFLLSGACGLGYEIVWARMWAVGLGHEVPSILAVVAAFFGGLALGAYLLDGPVSRSARPGRWYVGLELVQGLWALGTVWTIPWGGELVTRLAGTTPGPLRHWLVAFGAPFLVLLPATLAMGGTLPAMDRFVSRLRGEARNVGRLYALNTLGAVLGTLAAAFLLVPALGLTRTVLLFAAGNLLCALAIGLGHARGEGRRPPVSAPPQRDLSAARLRATLFVTGALGIGYEVLGVRVIGQVLENTVYSFACALAVFLCATAVGSALYQRLPSRSDFAGRLDGFLLATSLACLFGIVVMSRADDVHAWMLERGGSGFGPAIAAELALAALVFFVAALFMGATFAHLAQGLRGSAGGVGRALALNTLGGSLAPPVFGVLLLPALGAKATLLVCAGGYLLLSTRLSARRLVPGVAALAAVLLLPVDLRLVRPLPGGAILAHRDGVLASVAVVSDADGHRYLKVNDRFQMGSTAQGFLARRSGHIPLLLHPDPRRALYLGLGTGTTFHVTGLHPGLAARSVELLPEVVALREHFQTPEDAIDESRQTVSTADARRFVRADTERYDVIVADLFHPARDGSGSLYTEEHFLAVRERLSEGGLFCQWLPLYQLERETLEIVLRTFAATFDEVDVFLSDFSVQHPVLGLVGRTRPQPYTPTWYEDRVRDAALGEALERLALRDGYQLLGCYLGDRAWITRLAGEGPRNRDDRPLVTYLAPRLVYGGVRPAEENLSFLLERRDATPAALLGPAPSAFARRLGAYWTARDHYLRGSLSSAVASGESLGQLLASVRASPDFATGYFVVLEIASTQAATRPDLARQLLDALIAAHPRRPEARSLRARLFGS